MRRIKFPVHTGDMRIHNRFAILPVCITSEDSSSEEIRCFEKVMTLQTRVSSWDDAYWKDLCFIDTLEQWEDAVEKMNKNNEEQKKLRKAVNEHFQRQQKISDEEYKKVILSNETNTTENAETEQGTITWGDPTEAV